MIVHIARNQKHVTGIGKDMKGKFVFNVDKIIKSKVDSDVQIMNDMQLFILNYELVRILTKIVADGKHTDLLYINKNLSVTSVNNLISMLSKTYKNHVFDCLLYCEDEDDEEYFNIVTQRVGNVTLVKSVPVV